MHQKVRTLSWSVTILLIPLLTFADLPIVRIGMTCDGPHEYNNYLLELFQNDKSDLKKLWENSRYMWNRLKEIGLDIGNTKSQVVPVMAGNDLRLREISKRLFERGLYTGFVTFPAVPRNSTRLRLSISSAHTKEQMDKASSILKEIYAEVK